MKIAFFLNNDELEGLDWTNVYKANPGAGGTEFLIVLEAYLMSLEQKVSLTLYAQKQSVFPKTIPVKYVPTLKDAIFDANENIVDYLVFKEVQRDPLFNYLKNLPSRTGLVIWSHNFMQKKSLEVYAECGNVKSIICVGREMLDLYRDEKAFRKMDYIYNGCIFKDYKELIKEIVPVSLRKNSVVYVGSIIPAKSFHWLAKVWKNVLKQVPDAELYVIGSGNLYDKNASLGKYGIASEAYENEFMPHLTDSKGNILPSVHFLGKMGEEKNEILKKVKVGVPNPSGRSETFGLTAVEMQMMGCNVVTMKCPGYLDTVVCKDHLYDHSYQLSSFIIEALKHPEDKFFDTFHQLQEHFDCHKVHEQWMDLFEHLNNGQCKIHDLDKDIPNLSYNHKWLRMLFGSVNKFVRYCLPTELSLKRSRIYGKCHYYMEKLKDALVR